VQHVYGPLWRYRISVYLGIIPLYFLAFLVLILGTVTCLQLAGVLPPFRRSESATILIFPTLFLAGITVVGFAMLYRRWCLLDSVLILGERGIAEWTHYDSTIITTESLGTQWILHPVGPHNDGLPYTVYLALARGPFERLYITGFYQNAASIAKLLREKLAERIQQTYLGDLSLWRPDLNLERTATEGGNEGIQNLPPSNLSESRESE
jgi:hypothetical protein